MSNSLWLGTRKGLFQVQRSGNSTWAIAQRAFLGDQVPMVYVSPDGQTIYAALQLGHFGAKMHRSIDGGARWQEIAVPTYPTKPEDIPDVIDPMRNKAIPWSLELIWSLERANDGRLWCGTLPGGLFTSDDAGDSWQLNMPLWMIPNRSNWFGGGYDYPGIHSICVDPESPHRVTLAISCGGVWMTEDRGETWRCTSRGMRAEYMPPERAFEPDIQDPHRMVQCPSHPNSFWVQHHNGIFRSTNYCEHWIEMTGAQPSSFGFAVAVHPHQPETAWFVPAIKDERRIPTDGRFLVTRTRDGGQSFDQLATGLPQSDAYHLVYRHGMGVDSSGERIAIGSTTGALWISENGGDSWDSISKDLPPIYCVRF